MDPVEYLKFFRSLGVTHLNVRPVDKLTGPDPRTAKRKPAAAAPSTAADVSAAPTLFPEPAAPPVDVKTLEEIREEIGDCRRCKLCKGRTHIVFGVGNPRADLMFVGEAPGADEDAQGVPFVGAAGQLLTRIIQTMFDLDRKQVYIANIIKCRPPGNRDPEPDEVEQCEGFLHQQIETVQPKVVVALGRCAAQTLLRTKTAISRLRGEFFEYRGRLLLPTFHPSYLLRTPSKKREVFVDMKAVRAKLVELGSEYYR